MKEVVGNSWALLIGIFFLLVGNGLQGTLLGIRGSIEGYDAATMSWVMSAYFVGYLVGSRRAPYLIRNVGHVRVFAALGSMISAAFIIYAAAPTPLMWIVMRFVVGYCFAGVYVVAESWLNEASTNENRGKALSAYVFAQMMGMVTAQAIVAIGDPTGYTLFVVMSVLVSISFLPILLTVLPVPSFSASKPMSLRQLYTVSPLGCVGMLLLGAIFSGLFGMAAVYGSEQGMTVSQVAAFVAAIYVGGMICQIPVGMLSDVVERRRLIVILTLGGSVLMLAGLLIGGGYPVLIGMAMVAGGVAYPLYSLIIAYTNDHLETSDMASASGGLIFISGCGAAFGPVLIGILMNQFGPQAFFVYIAGLMFLIGGYASYRATRRAAPNAADSLPYAVVLQQSSAVAVEVAQEIAIEAAEEATRQEGADDTTPE